MESRVRDLNINIEMAFPNHYFISEVGSSVRKGKIKRPVEMEKKRYSHYKTFR